MVERDTLYSCAVSTLQPETLALKLAALVQYLATGEAGHEHTLKAEELQPLLEQMISQLQALPEALEDYRPQENEPAYQSEDRVRLITGFSGSGKTSWVGEFGRPACTISTSIDSFR